MADGGRLQRRGDPGRHPRRTHGPQSQRAGVAAAGGADRPDADCGFVHARRLTLSRYTPAPYSVRERSCTVAGCRHSVVSPSTPVSRYLHGAFVLPDPVWSVDPAESDRDVAADT